MKRLLGFLALLTCLFSMPSWAVNCYQNSKGGLTEAKIDLPSFTIPSDITLNQKVWESPDINITVYCEDASGWSKSTQTEDLYAWIKLSAFNSTEVLNNPYFTFGVTYNGADYEGTDQGIDLNVCLDKHDEYYGGTYHNPVCNGSTLQKNMTFNARFRLYVKVKAIPADSTTVYNFGEINVLQFDGQGGANLYKTAKNLRFYIDGLDNIHYLSCSASIKLEPETQVVDFKTVTNIDLANHTDTQQTFSISTVRDQTAGCTEQFDITTSFYTSDAPYDNTHLDLGNGLLLNVFDSTLNLPVLFNQYMDFTTYVPSDPSTVTHNYTAELTAHPTKKLVEGPFSKDVIIKINYR
ncbi:pilus assembly protein [Klebsiella spallanzanii]|uniref:pilus assembly protein n=1 Tax=Klebsiella spallanzanii TaxID=2587528 RepID=UPI00259460DC|nr:pilus assembly protein [Klebsiella spallanzanii]MDM4205642.1 pilus assembly protein [Klebsiella spallanzanii]